MREEPVTVPTPEPEITIRPPKRQSSTPSRHSLKCAICNHPDRAAIEFDFLNWRNPGDLVKSYRFRGLSTIYRHAHATGLFAKRRLNLRFAMERIVERVNEVPVTATAVIRAARAISRINDEGQWVDPPSHVIVTHIHAEDSSFVGAGLALPAPAQQAKTPCGTGSQSVDSSVEVSSEDRQARAGTEGFVGRGFNRDIKRRSSKPSIRARQGGEGNVPSIPAHDSSETISRPSLIFDDALLDEPSDSASAELPRIDGKPAPPEIILELSPEFARCREERRRAIEADRQARAASHSPSGGFTPQASAPPVGAPLVYPDVGRTAPAPACPEPSRRSEAEALSLPKGRAQQAKAPRGTGSQPVQDNSARRGTSSLAANPETVPSPTPQEEQSVASSPSLLPQAAPENSAPSALTSSPSRSAGPPLGSSGSADPPFPFTQESRRRWKPRRRF